MFIRASETAENVIGTVASAGVAGAFTFIPLYLLDQ